MRNMGNAAEYIMFFKWKSKILLVCLCIFYKKILWSKMRALFFLLIILIKVEKKIRLLRLTEIVWSFPGKLLWFQRNHGRPPGVFAGYVPLASLSLGCKAAEQATISQVINSRHSSFLTVNQETNTSKSAGSGPPGQYIQSPEGKSCAIRAQPWVFVLLYTVSLLFHSLLTQYLFSACAIQPDLHVICSCSQ